MAYQLIFDVDRCKGCELCISVCPKQILALGAGTNVKGYRAAECIDQEACVGCASCAKMCPDSVITVMKDE